MASNRAETESGMQDEQWRGQISSDANILLGKPCISGTRISVELILQKLGAGETIEDILLDYPQITRQQMKLCKEYHMQIISAKEEMLQIIADQPEDSSFDELLHELAMARMIERGLKDHQEGRVISHEQVKREAQTWRK